jgi:hypothetical protein
MDILWQVGFRIVVEAVGIGLLRRNDVSTLAFHDAFAIIIVESKVIDTIPQFCRQGELSSC